MIKNYLLGLFLHVQTNAILFKKAAAKFIFQMLGLTGFAILMLTIGIFFKNVHVVFLGAMISSVIFILAYWSGVVLTETVVGGAKMVPIKEKDGAKKRDEAVEKVAAGLARTSKLFLTTSLILSFVSVWTLAFGFGSFKLGIVEMVVMTSLVFSTICFYGRKETVYPQWIIGILTVWACLSYFSTLDTPLSRALAVRLHNITIGTERNSDSKATAVIVSDAILYRINDEGDLDEWTGYKGTKLEVGSVVRVKETRRFDDELFTKIVIPNANGSYARGTKAYVQTEVLSSSKKLTVFPNAVNPEYAISKEKVNGKEVWRVYFLTDEPIDIATPVGKWYTLTGINSGELFAMNTRKDGAYAGRMGNDLKAGIKYHNRDARSILAAAKGTVLNITWSNR